MSDTNSMSKELQDKADRMMKELIDSLTPIKEEIKTIRISSESKQESHLDRKTR